MKSGAFTGGALSFKGDKKKKKAKKKETNAKHTVGSADNKPPAAEESHDDMTEAERKAWVRKKERERKDLEKMAQKSHREAVEEFNEKLGNATEHNDIPRVSAAGNG